MDYYPDQGHNTISDRLDVLVRMLDACAALSTAARHSMLTPDVYGYTLGKKYARVWYDMSNGQRMVAFFVQMDNGDVWKAAGWKAPALNFVRGNIMTPEGRYAVTGGKLSEVGYFYGGF
jgi:hypothetical protein